MAGLFDLLNTVIGKITQNSVTYATAPTPPDGDSSTKVATTAFVADKTAAIPSGNVAVWSRDFTYFFQNYVNDGSGVKAPAGGTWFCFGTYTIAWDNGSGSFNSNGVVASGGQTLVSFRASNGGPRITNNAMAIKIV